MNTLTRLSRTADSLRKIVEDEGGLELELSKKRVKTLLRIADQLDQVVFEQREEIIKDMQAVKEAEDAARMEAIDHVTALAEEYGLAIKVLTTKPKGVKHPKVEATSSEIRSWAKDNNIDVNPLGIIPKRVREAFELANA